MKKFFLLILASLFAVFSLTACADEDKNDTAGKVNGVNLPKNLELSH